MGITGLLPFLKNQLQPASMKDYRGCTVAIDSYCWLHKGAFSCAEKLASGEKTDQYVYYCLKFVNMLLSLDIKPIMVFDGCRLPSKRDVERQRRERREMYRKKAAQLLREGKKAEARECLTKCVDITPQMALELIKACRSKGVDCVVAPYEADAQLAYLSRTGVAQIVITEDSDLILFGCEKVMFKMDPAGNGMILNKSDLHRAMDMRADCYSFDKFRYMCILSGCDYLASLPGIGLKKALRLLQRTRQPDMRLVLKKLPSLLNMNVVVSSEYIEGFVRADNTFLYQLVYDATQRKLLPLHPYPDDLDIRDLNYAGPPISQEKALQIALGNIDIYTGQQLDDFDPDDPVYRKQQARNKPRDQRDMLHRLSIWDRDYRPLSRPATTVQPRSTDNEGEKQQQRKPASTLGKVCTVPLPAACKRPRSEEAELSEQDLASLYGGGAAKKSCPEIPVSDILSAMDTNITPSAQEKTLKRANPFSKASEDSRTKNFTPPKQCSKPDSNISKHEGEISENMQSPGKIEQPEKTPSPSSKNPFRKTGNSSGKRFMLNEQKTHVVSRFFNKSKSLQPTEFGKELEKNLETPAEKPKPSWEQSDNDDEEDADGNTCESESHISAQRESGSHALEERVQVQVTEPSPSNSSPYSVFNKLSKFQSKFDRKLGSSPATSHAFKPVMRRESTAATSTAATSTAATSTVDVVLQLDSSQQSQSQKQSQSQQSQRDASNALDTSTDLDASQKSIALCSIDTDSLSMPSLPQLPDTDEATVTPKQQKTLTAFFHRKSTSGGKDTREESSKKPTQKSTPLSTPTNSSSAKKASLPGKGSCRQSGLRKKPSVGGGSKENPIQRFFGLDQFKYNSNLKQTIPKQKPLSPNNT